MNRLQARAYRRPFHPFDLGASLIAWWCADDHGTSNMTDDGAGLISAWKDRVGGLSLTAAGSARPTWNATGLNGKPANIFDGSANALAGTSLGSLPVSNAEGWIWASASQTAASGGGVRVAFACGGGSNGQNRRVSASGALLSQASDGSITSSKSTPLWSGASIVAGHFDPVLITARVLGANGSPVAWSAATLTTRMRMGASSATSAASFWQGPIRHVPITGALSTLQINQLDGWFAWDAGLQALLPADHPYLSVPP